MSSPVSPEGVLGRDALASAGDRWRAAGRRIVFTNGCFDLLHPGHLSLLAFAREQGDVLLVAINDDASVCRLKGKGRPIHPAHERAELLLALRWVDAVTVFHEDTPLETIERVRPHVLIKGAEYGDGEIVGETFVVASGGQVCRYPMKPGHATTKIVERIRSAESSSSEGKSE